MRAQPPTMFISQRGMRIRTEYVEDSTERNRLTERVFVDYGGPVIRYSNEPETYRTTSVEDVSLLDG
jgi:hypothetical protein